MSEALHYNEDLILRYLNGELTDEEAASLRQQMEADTQLRNEVEGMQLALQAIKYYGLHQKVKAIGAAMGTSLRPVESKPKVVPMKRAVRYALTIAASVLIAFAAVQGYRFYTLSADAVFNEAYIGYDISSARGNATEVATIEKAYSQKNYTEVIQQAIRKTTLTPYEQFLTGLAYLETGNIASSVKWFQKLYAEGNLYKQDAEFYLALCYIKEKNYDAALPLMNAISDNPSHPYHERITKSLIRKTGMLKWK